MTHQQVADIIGISKNAAARMYRTEYKKKPLHIIKEGGKITIDAFTVTSPEFEPEVINEEDVTPEEVTTEELELEEPTLEVVKAEKQEDGDDPYIFVFTKLDASSF